MSVKSNIQKPRFTLFSCALHMSGRVKLELWFCVACQQHEHISYTDKAHHLSFRGQLSVEGMAFLVDCHLWSLLYAFTFWLGSTHCKEVCPDCSWSWSGLNIAKQMFVQKTLLRQQCWRSSHLNCLRQTMAKHATLSDHQQPEILKFGACLLACPHIHVHTFPWVLVQQQYIWSSLSRLQYRLQPWAHPWYSTDIPEGNQKHEIL